MNSFWTNLYDSFKDRRYGGLFLSTILAVIGLLVLGAATGVFNHRIYFPYMLPGVGLLVVSWIWRLVRQSRSDRRNKLRNGLLSRDELRVARSKLRNGMKPIHRPAPKAPDTFLKY
jgi:uncharacterized membrane protein YeaQ/YmgE (transglycosylase-associated protein family)